MLVDDPVIVHNHFVVVSKKSKTDKGVFQILLKSIVSGPDCFKDGVDIVL